MTKIEELRAQLAEHLQHEDNESQDREFLKDVQTSLEEFLLKQKPCEGTCACEESKKTNYDVIVASMTPEILADMRVKLVNVNNAVLYWMTSTGQVFPYDQMMAAYEYELQFLKQELAD